MVNVPEFWNTRYNNNWRGSGDGSRGELALFKANTINKFIRDNNVRNIVDLGCGDGEIAALIKVRTYTGLDVSEHAIQLCQTKFEYDQRKHFDMLWNGIPRAEMTMSLDVIYHLLDDDAFVDHMFSLFEYATRFVCIYSCNFDGEERSHIRPRKFTNYVPRGWRLKIHKHNRYPAESWSEFFFYEKVT